MMDSTVTSVVDSTVTVKNIDSNTTEPISYDNWKLLYNHFTKTLTVIIHHALSSKEYMHVRSALLLLSRVSVSMSYSFYRNNIFVHIVKYNSIFF